MSTREERLISHFRKIFQELGVDLNDADFKETPDRLMKMYKEMFDPSPPPKVTLFPNKSKESELILVKNIDVVLVCPHHLVFVYPGTVHVGYVPDEYLVGLSKIARIATWLAKPPKTQEDYTQELSDFLMKLIRPKGVMVIADFAHGCMRCRGTNQRRSTTITSSIAGVFAKPPKGKNPREEMLELLKLSRNE